MKILEIFRTNKPHRSDSVTADPSPGNLGNSGPEISQPVHTHDPSPGGVDVDSQEKACLTITHHKEGEEMTEELITPDNLSKELLKSILDSAFMDASYDSEGDLRVRDQVNCFILPNQERKDRVQLITVFGFKPEASELQRLQAVNRINSQYIIVKAVVGENNSLLFQWDIPITGGITKKAFVLALKRFCSIPHGAIVDCASDVVA